MKNTIILLIIALVSGLSTGQDLKFSGLDKSPLDVVIYRGEDRAAIARVIYSRPSKNDREVFGKLVPYNQVWRTGANEATEITFYKPVKIADQEVPAGTYSIYTIPGEENWQLILNKQTTQWGTNYNEELNLLQVPMDVMPAPETIESFSISFVDEIDGGRLFLGWDNVIASIHMDVESD
ncbi:DUF2911 domain-containing protein [Nonlabens ponticola]|uniref:DUF2911 domain-containing protein n=1 Tax=Nonlabens ponticola TaxID=2496866 RepID=A0A3S9MX34_9FLAO|nr:DUF2911 domain-containing protein [Nonlabens ponticola]AZQ43699.1 DUF2911 domain-containing protein [Nonlabens ponticola]